LEISVWKRLWTCRQTDKYLSVLFSNQVYENVLMLSFLKNNYN
jgi:hypothetical protein